MRISLPTGCALLCLGCASAGTPVARPIAEFRVTDSIAAGTDLIISERRVPPGTALEPHAHPGEEIVLLLEGSALHVEEGRPDREVVAGETIVIPAGALHAPVIGPDGARIIVIRLQPAAPAVNRDAAP